MSGTPVVTIEYKHKTRGIMRDLGLGFGCFVPSVLWGTCWWTKYVNLFRTVTVSCHKSGQGLGSFTKTRSALLGLRWGWVAVELLMSHRALSIW